VASQQKLPRPAEDWMKTGYNKFGVHSKTQICEEFNPNMLSKKEKNTNKLR
jgi:hypothetical protein